MKQVITAHGHENVLGEHSTTIEITKHADLSVMGDCIIGVKASHGCADLNPELKDLIQSGKKVKVTLKAGGVQDAVTGIGSKFLTLSHPDDIVIRKSDFTCSRTLMIKADKAACDLKEELIKKLEDPKTKLEFIIETLENKA
ncbi:MAG: DUF371 domain-containing protein [archaeon]